MIFLFLFCYFVFANHFCDNQFNLLHFIFYLCRNGSFHEIFSNPVTYLIIYKVFNFSFKWCDCTFHKLYSLFSQLQFFSLYVLFNELIVVIQSCQTDKLFTDMVVYSLQHIYNVVPLINAVQSTVKCQPLIVKKCL